MPAGIPIFVKNPFGLPDQRFSTRGSFKSGSRKSTFCVKAGPCPTPMSSGTAREAKSPLALSDEDFTGEHNFFPWPATGRAALVATAHFGGRGVVSRLHTYAPRGGSGWILEAQFRGVLRNSSRILFLQLFARTPSWEAFSPASYPRGTAKAHSTSHPPHESHLFASRIDPASSSALSSLGLDASDLANHGSRWPLTETVGVRGAFRG